MTGRQATYTGINRYADNALLNPDPASQGGILRGLCVRFGLCLSTTQAS